jgi:hypothetical protein
VIALFGPNGIQTNEVVLLVGLLLVGVGFWWLPEWGVRSGAVFVPGAAFVWIAMPTRAAFVQSALKRKAE